MKSTVTDSILKLRTAYAGRVITLNVETVRLPNGHVTDLEIMHHPGGAAVVAIDAESRVCLLRQFRHAVGGWIWELPAGKLEPAEPPQETARRELDRRSRRRGRRLGIARRLRQFPRRFHRSREALPGPRLACRHDGA